MKNIELPTSNVEDIRLIETTGPWNAKSGGLLEVQFALDREATIAFLDYDNPEFDRVKEESGIDIRGSRSYTVRDIPEGSVGGNEWHKARTEYVSALAGRAVWECVDSSGQRREFELDGTNAIIQPPGILHTYRGLEDGTRLQVFCNTLYPPNEPSTHDTYSRDSFYQLRAQPYLEDLEKQA